MLKRTIKYKNFDEEDVEDVFYFNLSKPEIVELSVEGEGGFGKLLQRIVEEKNNRELVKQFKHIILMAYGVKSEDGNQFIKTDELRSAFSHHAAFQALYMELLEKEDAMADFVNGILPKDMPKQDQDKPVGPPVSTN